MALPVGGPRPWWMAFDATRFPQPRLPGPGATPVGLRAVPLAVPELDRLSPAPWPAPVLPGAGATDPSGWWLADDGRWYPPDLGSPLRRAPGAGVGTTRPHRSLRVVGAVVGALAVVAGGAVVGAALRPAGVHSTVPTAPTAPTGGRSAATPPTSPATRPSTSVPATAGPVAGAPTPTTSPPAAATTPTAAPGAEPVTAPTPQATSGVVYQYESATTPATVAQLVAAPATYAGHSVAFTGVIVAFALDDSGGADAMYVSEPGSPSTVALVQLSPYDEVTQITTGDTVTVWGDVTGQVNYANSVGQPTEVTNVNQVYLADRTTGYQDTGDPSPS